MVLFYFIDICHINKYQQIQKSSPRKRTDSNPHAVLPTSPFSRRLTTPLGLSLSMPQKGSNLQQESQNLLCYHYTMWQFYWVPVNSSTCLLQVVFIPHQEAKLNPLSSKRISKSQPSHWQCDALPLSYCCLL